MAAEVNTTQEPTRPVMANMNADGTYTAQSATSSKDFKIRAECLLPSRLVVPIIFVPGNMGTRLRVKGRPDSSAWFPPEGTWEGLCQVLKGLGRSAATRQRLLNPDTTEVDDNGRAQPDKTVAYLLSDAPGATDAERGKWRGWGQLHGDSYLGILSILEKRLASILANGCASDAEWKSAVMDWQDDRKMGAQKTFTPLDEEDLRRTASAFYPVHAVGYNWLQSNGESAKRLQSEIERILKFYKNHNKIADQVILVTHSMGGFVARGCFQLPGMEDKIMGIMHGVMPAIGAPAAYKRMRSGFEGILRPILGRDAGDITAVLTHSPAQLELLPNRQYRTKAPDGKEYHWLRASVPTSDDRDADLRNTFLGENSDPHKSIYVRNDERCWWRLVKEELIDPAGDEDREKAEKEAKKSGKQIVKDLDHSSAFEDYLKNLLIAKTFQDSIEDKYHYNTFAYYGADKEQKTWNEVNWQADAPTTAKVADAELAYDDLHGRIRLTLPDALQDFSIQDAAGAGDGTVPAESGEAPLPHVVQIFRHEGKIKNFKSYEHQMSYAANVAQASTLYSISRIVADSKWLSANIQKA